MGRINFQKCCNAIISVAAVLSIGFLIFLLLGDDVEIRNGRDDDTIMLVQNVSVNFMEDELSPVGEKWEYCFRLEEDLLRATQLAFFVSHQYADVYLDGENIFSLRPAGWLSIVKTVGRNWVMIPVYPEDAGKEVRVVLTPVYSDYGGRDVEFWIGPATEIYRTQLLDALPELLLSLANIVVGLTIFCIALYCLIKKHSGWNLITFGLLAISVGLWRYADSAFSYLIWSQSTVFLYSMSVSMLTAVVILLSMSIKIQFHKNCHRLIDIFCVTAAVIFALQLLAQIFGVYDLRETLFITHGMVAACALFIIGNTVYEWFKHSKQDNASVFPYTAWILAVGVLLDLLVYNMRSTASGLPFTQTAIVCFVMLEGLLFLREFIAKEQQLAEKELQLIESRSITLMSQIRSHFVFNILNAISGMCKYDPEKADETVVRFARYLRANIDIMQEDSPVTFRTALRHLEDYIVLEQIRFGDKIKYQTDIQEEHFLLPPLLLQPLVENAIKHGLTPKESGGTVSFVHGPKRTGYRSW